MKMRPVDQVPGGYRGRPPEGKGKSDPEERFWSYVTVTEYCWIWLGGKDGSGYGSFWDGERNVKAHTYAYKLLIGPIPDGKVCDHLCNNRWCVNPYHIHIVTIHENLWRGRKTQLKATAKEPGNKRTRLYVWSWECLHGHTKTEVFQTPCRHCQRKWSREWNERNDYKP